jgi:predicted porin
VLIDDRTSSSFYTPSRIGFKGTEDLGNGLSANFDLQTGGMTLENGSSANNTTTTTVNAAVSPAPTTSTSATKVVSAVKGGLDFTREAWVGLASKTAGAIRIGRSSSIATKNQAGYDLNGISGSSALANINLSPVTWYGSSRRSSQFQYLSADMGGSSIQFGYTMKGDGNATVTDTAAVGSAKNRASFGYNFNAGPLSLGVIAETKRDDTFRTALALGGSYDLGVVKLAATYNRGEKAKNATGTVGSKGFAGGVSAPFGAFVVGAQVARNQDVGATATELWTNYILSKRTNLYLDFVNVNGNYNTSNYTFAKGASTRAVGTGILTTF